MPDILHTFPVRAPAGRVYEMFATPHGLDAWWTESSQGTPSLGSEFRLGFGPEYQWRARVTDARPGECYELEFTHAMDDWVGSRLRVELESGDGVTTVRFAHVGWREATEHFRVSAFCWAMYLRLLRLHLERGLTVPYAERLDA